MPPDWSTNFANEDQQEKSRLIKEYQDLALLISKVQLGQDEMPFEDYLTMKGEDIIGAKYCMSELVDMALGQKIKSPGFDLNAKPLDSLHVGERPPPIVKLANAQHHASLLATFLWINY